jgi:uncharacterized membrane protein
MEALGPVLILASIPMMFGWLPRNRYFGLRVPATLSSDAVWYAVNARCGRHMFALGLFMVLLEFVLPVNLRVPTLATVGTVGFVVITAADWRAANRSSREDVAAQTRTR